MSSNYLGLHVYLVHRKAVLHVSGTIKLSPIQTRKMNDVLKRLWLFKTSQQTGHGHWN